MGTFEHIVVAIDDSEAARRAADFAVRLAAWEGARLSFCSVVDPAPSYLVAAEGAPLDGAPLLTALHEEARGYGLGAISRAARCGVEASSIVLEGAPGEAIRRVADEKRADAIVVGTHGRHGIARALLGSVAAALVRSAGVPVFAVRAEAAIERDGPIAVALDATPPSAAALRAAIALAGSQHSPLHLIHVFGDRDIARIHDHPGYDPVVARSRAMTQTVDEFDDLADRVRAASQRFTSEMCEGDAAHETIVAAQRANARFIVAGTHARGPVGRLVRGSVAERLVRDATIPVMTVRA